MISEDLAAQFYRGITRAEPSPADIQTYAAAESETAAIEAIIRDQGAETLRVVTFYQIYYNRLPDLPGLDFWTGVARAPAGISDAALAGAFFGAGEFETIYGGRETEDAVRLIYENVLGREADIPGLEFWTNAVLDPDNNFGLRELGLAFATASETQTTFAPLLDDYLTDLAEVDTAPASLFSYTDKDGGGGTRFNGAEGKSTTTSIQILDKGTPVELLNTGDLGADNAVAADIMNLTALRNDPRFQGIDGSGFTVAVIDSGIDLDHPAFGRLTNGVSERIVAAIDFTPEFDGPDDINGHGTNVASIVASEDPQYLGVAPGANIAGLQALQADGRGSNADIEQSLRWVLENANAYNIVAVNLSLGNGSNLNRAAPNPSGYADELAALRSIGVVVTSSAGNEYYTYQEPGTSDLAADPNVISVGALWDQSVQNFFWNSGAKDFVSTAGDITSFSQRATDPSIDTIFAPGALIVGAAPGGGTAALGGTSQAAPQVAGLVALAQEIAVQYLGRLLTPQEFEAALRAGATTVSDAETPNDNVRNTNAVFQQVDALAMAEAILAIGGIDDPGGPIDPPPGAEDPIPGDATTTAVIAPGGAVQSVVDFEFDSDWFRIDLVGGEVYTFRLQGAPSGNGTLADPLVAIRDEAGRVLASDDDSGLEVESELGFVAPETGTYFLEARAFEGGTGTYLLSAEGQAVSGDLPAGPSTPSVLTPGTAVASEIDELGDHDWHRLDVTPGTTYSIFLTGLTLEDPVLQLFASDGTLLGANDDFDGLDSALAFNAEAAGSVFVDAGAFADNGTGTYEVFVQIESPGGGGGDIPGDPSTAARLAPGDTVEGVLDFTGDTDWYRLDLDAGVNYEFALLGASSGVGNLEDPLVALYDAAGVELAFNDDAPGTLDSLLEFRPISDGTYYVSAESYDGASAGSYRLSMAASGGGGGGGDLPGDVTTPAVIAPGEAVADVLETPGDVDWFATELFAGTTYTIALRGAASGGGDLSDPLVALFDAVGREITFDDDGGVDLDSELVFTPQDSGIYYVSAESYEGLFAGSYTLELDAAGTGERDILPGDPSTTARLPVGSALAGTLDFNGDEDWVRVSLRAGVEYQIDLEGVSSGQGTLEDPVLGVYDAFGGLIASDDDAGAGLDSQLFFTPTATGDYFLAAAGFGGVETGTFLLSISGDETLQEVPGDPSTPFAAVFGQPLSGEIEFGPDTDWYAVELQAGATYGFALSGLGAGLGTLSDPLVALYDDAGGFLAFDDDGGDGLDSFLEYTATYTGTHYVSAESFGAATGSYELLAIGQGGGPAPVDDIPVLAEGRLVAHGDTTTGTIDFVDDLDFFAVDLFEGVEYTFTLAGAAGGFGTLEDPGLTLFDDTLELVGSDDDGGLGLDSQLTVVAPRTGTYALGAEGVDGTTGTYTLGFVFAEDDGFSAVTQPGQEFIGVLDFAGDVDWIRADLQGGVTYDAFLAGRATDGFAPVFDPILTVRDALGFELAANDDAPGSGGFDSAVTFTPPIDGSYFFSAASVSGQEADAAYSLFIA